MTAAGSSPERRPVAAGATVVGRWWLLAVVGVVLILVGVLDVCLLAPLAGKPLRGSAFRASAQR